MRPRDLLFHQIAARRLKPSVGLFSRPLPSSDDGMHVMSWEGALEGRVWIARKLQRGGAAPLQRSRGALGIVTVTSSAVVRNFVSEVDMPGLPHYPSERGKGEEGGLLVKRYS
ncbi:hypothetical protein L209DRAFT_520894 [Thermothelomyces heterothallicus CBS 203.75]